VFALALQDPKVKPPAPAFDASADAKAQVAAAVKKAAGDNQRALVLFGSGDDAPSNALHELLKKDNKLAHTILYEYQLVTVETGKLVDKNLELAAACHVTLEKSGIPYLAVLGSDGLAVAGKTSAELSEGGAPSSAKLALFLESAKAKPLDAKQVLEGALAKATAERRPSSSISARPGEAGATSSRSSST
jgi:hypothetical protein